MKEVFPDIKRRLPVFLLLAAICYTGCSEDSGFQPAPSPGITVLPDSAAVMPRGQVAFAAVVTQLSCDSLLWYVNGVLGGDQIYGTITSDGLYTAPVFPPRNPVVTVKAACAADTNYYDEAVVLVLLAVDIEIEDYVHIESDNGMPIIRVLCSGASKGWGVDGVDAAGDELTCNFSIQYPGSYSAVLRSALQKGAEASLLATVRGNELEEPQSSGFDIVGRGFG